MSATATTTNALANTAFAPFSAETFQEFGRWLANLANDNSKVGVMREWGRVPTDDRVSCYSDNLSELAIRTEVALVDCGTEEEE